VRCSTFVIAVCGWFVLIMIVHSILRV